MTAREKLAIEHPEEDVEKLCHDNCPEDYGYLGRFDRCPKDNGEWNADTVCPKCWDREIPEKDIPRINISGIEFLVCTPDKARAVNEFKDGKITMNQLRKAFGLYTVTGLDGTVYAQDSDKQGWTGSEPHILDSGDRTEFESGAVRDMRKGKGRCDLLPLDVIATYLDTVWDRITDGVTHLVFTELYNFQESGDVNCLYRALDFVNPFGNMFTMLLEVAKHFEDGAIKYGDNNWRKGIPVRFYIDSAIRHYMKFLRGDKDEPHDRAVCWNLMCAIWTCKHHPELNEYAKEETHEKDD